MNDTKIGEIGRGQPKIHAPRGRAACFERDDFAPENTGKTSSFRPLGGRPEVESLLSRKSLYRDLAISSTLAASSVTRPCRGKSDTGLQAVREVLSNDVPPTWAAQRVRECKHRSPAKDICEPTCRRIPGLARRNRQQAETGGSENVS